MKKQIEKIIEKYYDPDTEVLESGKIAGDICTLILNFIKWKDDFTDYDAEEESYTVEVETHVIEEMTLEQVFNFWYINRHNY
jgi:hypothetical protein